jgi:hypothetical protein
VGTDFAQPWLSRGFLQCRHLDKQHTGLDKYLYPPPYGPALSGESAAAKTLPLHGNMAAGSSTDNGLLGHRAERLMMQ